MKSLPEFMQKIYEAQIIKNQRGKLFRPNMAKALMDFILDDKIAKELKA